MPINIVAILLLKLFCAFWQLWPKNTLFSQLTFCLRRKYLIEMAKHLAQLIIAAGQVSHLINRN